MNEKYDYSTLIFNVNKQNFKTLDEDNSLNLLYADLFQTQDRFVKPKFVGNHYIYFLHFNQFEKLHHFVYFNLERKTKQLPIVAT